MMTYFPFTRHLYFTITVAYLITQLSFQRFENTTIPIEEINQATDIDADDYGTLIAACIPPLMVQGLYDPDVPLPPNPAIFGDPLIKNEIMSDGIAGKDKEFGDIDNDGLIDILYTKNGNELWFIPNTGSATNPDYQVVDATNTGFIGVFSFRLIDWYGDGVNDLVVLENTGLPQINLYLDVSSQIGFPAPFALLLDNTQFPYSPNQLIEVGDINGDAFPDILVSDQGFINGTVYFENTSLTQNPPTFQLFGSQSFQSPMIPDNIGTHHTPELYDADCDGDLDLFISDPFVGLTTGGHVDYYENTGPGSPFIYFTQQSANPFGLVDIPGDDLRCDWVPMRFVDFFGDGCPEVIAYNYCHTNNPTGDIFYYKNNCSCEAAFTFELIDSCRSFQFINNSTGTNLTYAWNFDDIPSGLNNTSTLQHPIHQFTTCGTYNVCLTVSGSGCDSTICHTVQITDLVPPVVLCKNGVVITLDANCIATLTPADIDDGSFDDCLLQSLMIDTSTFTACGMYPVTLTATDWCGNTATCNTIVQVVDNIPPATICPSDKYLATTGQNCSMVVNGIKWISIGDNCSTPSVTYTITGASNYAGSGDASGLTFMNGTSIVTYTVADDCGNTAACSFKVVVDCICNCQGNMVQNPGFNLGAVMGNFGTGGQINDWFRRTETPYIDGSSYCCDPFSMYFWAVLNYGESIYQPGFNFIAGHTYKISFCSKSNLRFGFTATHSPVMQFFYPYNCINCEDMGTSVQAISTIWAAYTLPLWTATQNADLMYIRGLGTGTGYHNTGRIDNVCVVEVFYSCCSDHKAFLDNSINIVNIYEDQERKEAVFEVGHLLECNSIDFINWGDGTDTIGPIEGNTILRHTYHENKSYPISYRIQESAPEDTSHAVCFENILFDTITIDPDTCYCNLFSGMAFRSHDSSGQEVICGDGPIALECPLPGTPISFTGGFYCNGSECSDNTLITWVLSGPDGIYIDSTAANPFFSINIPPLYSSHPGLDTISLYGQCGDQTCVCEIQFSLDCPDVCPCAFQDIQALDAAVDQGFSIALSNNSCKGCFAPLSLSDCETVSWFVNDIMGSPIGASIGNQSFCYEFAAAGTYTVIMVVTRKKSDGKDCETFIKSQSIMITCQDDNHCNTSIIHNPAFSEGAVAGGLNSGGASDGWKSISGNPQVFEGTPGSVDGWTIQLSGNLETADILTTFEPICLEPGTKNINLPFVWTAGTTIMSMEVFFYRGDHFVKNECNGIDCFEVGSVSLSNIDQGVWYDLKIPFDLSNWIAMDSCAGGLGVEVRPAIYITNDLGSSQGGEETYSYVQLDHFCVDGTIVAVGEVSKREAIRIYPNPTDGALKIELPVPAIKKTSLRVVNLAGQVLLDKQAEIGIAMQSIETTPLTAGMYFLQIIVDGRVHYVNKFVKQ